MSTTNDVILQAMAFTQTPANDDNSATFATAAGAQAQGCRVVGEVFRLTRSVATGAVILQAGIDAPVLVIVINDSPNSINLGADAGEKVNGTLTTSSFGAGVVAVASGASAVCFRSGTPSGKGGVATTSPNDWRIGTVS